jgi:hypothetical protein
MSMRLLYLILLNCALVGGCTRHIAHSVPEPPAVTAARQTFSSLGIPLDFQGQVQDLNGAAPSQLSGSFSCISISRDRFEELRRHHDPDAFAKWSKRLQGVRPGMTRSQVLESLAPEHSKWTSELWPSGTMMLQVGTSSGSHETWLLDAAHCATLAFSGAGDSDTLIYASSSPDILYFDVY